MHILSIDGSDSWDGTSPDIPGGTNIAGPWKTLSHALSEIRKQRPWRPGPEDQATINVLSGIHYQKSMLTFDNRESYLTIQAYDDEMPVTISGGQSLNNPIGGWTIDGQVRTGIFPLDTCGEILLGKNRLLPAKSPNVEWGFNKNVASGEYHYINVSFCA